MVILAVGGRIEVCRSEPPVRVPARLLNELREHARETHPEECCGLLVGPARGRFEELHRCRNEMTRLHQSDPATHPRDGREAFHMNEADYHRVLRDAEERGLLVTGVYHSHAEAGAYFSEMDQDYAAQPGFPFPEAIHVVISVVDGLARDVAAFEPADAGFVGRLVEAEAAS